MGAILVRRVRSAARLAVAFAFLASPSTARADLFLPVGDGVVLPQSHRAIIVESGRSEALVFETRVRSTARRFVWMRPFTQEPRALEVAEAPFTTLDEATIIRAPYNELIRDDLFGPSVVSILVDRLFRGPTPPRAAETGAPRDLTIESTIFLSGQVTSSTITYQLILPDNVATFLRSNGVEMTQEQIRAVAVTLNSGGVMLASIVEDAAPAEDRLARLGPFGFAYRPPHPSYPLVQRQGRHVNAQDFDLYLVGPVPRVSSAHETVWDVRPWEELQAPNNQFIVRYNADFDLESPIGIELSERLALPLSPTARLMRMQYRSLDTRIATMTFVGAPNAVEIPSGTQRGSGFDLFLCILLGLAPLLYTPESWFLLWLASRARARAREQGRAYGVRLWSFYAIAVGVYWLVVLPDAARVAGVVPLLIGIVQIGLPYTERDPNPVRSEFQKKKP